MALNISRLQPFRVEVSKAPWKASLILILIWTLWLAFVTTLSLPFRLSLDGSALVLLVGGVWWTVVEGAFFILVMSWIYSSFSLTPSGFYWLSAFLIFLSVRLASQRFSIHSSLQILFFVFIMTLFLNFLQVIFLKEILSVSILTSHLLASIFWTAILQATVSFVLSRFLISLLAPR